MPHAKKTSDAQTSYETALLIVRATILQAWIPSRMDGCFSNGIMFLIFTRVVGPGRRNKPENPNKPTCMHACRLYSKTLRRNSANPVPFRLIERRLCRTDADCHRMLRSNRTCCSRVSQTCVKHSDSKSNECMQHKNMEEEQPHSLHPHEWDLEPGQ